MSSDRFRRLVSVVLAAGVGLSAALIATGFLTALGIGWEGSPIGPNPAPTPLASFGDLPARLAVLEPLAIAQLGLLVLLATPVVRVATSVVAFASEGDRLYAAITAMVLAILLASIFLLR